MIHLHVPYYYGIVFIFFIISIFPPSWVKGINNILIKNIFVINGLLYSSIFSIAIVYVGYLFLQKLEDP